MGALSRSAPDLQLDKQEVERLLTLATRASVRVLLTDEISALEARLKIQAQLPQPIPFQKDAPTIGSLKEVTIDPDDGVRNRDPLLRAKAEALKNVKWTEITSYELKKGKGFQDDSVVVDLRLKGIEALPEDAISCDFTHMSMDLRVVGLEGISYRFRKTALQHDIVVSGSKWTRKKNHIFIEMPKVPHGGSMRSGFESWSDLIGRRKNEDEKKKTGGKPQDSLLGMMKDMYDDGDEATKRVIGEAMSKAYKPGGPTKNDLDDF